MFTCLFLLCQCLSVCTFLSSFCNSKKKKKIRTILFTPIALSLILSSLSLSLFTQIALSLSPLSLSLYSLKLHSFFSPNHVGNFPKMKRWHSWQSFLMKATICWTCVKIQTNVSSSFDGFNFGFILG